MGSMSHEEVSSAFHAELPRELANAIAGLGPPLSLHRVSPRVSFMRLWWGSMILLIGVIANIWFWFFAETRGVLYFLAIVGIPLGGLSLWLAYLEDRGIWVMRYPNGLLRWQRGEVLSLPWEDIMGITLVNVLRSGQLHGTTDEQGHPRQLWLSLEPVVNQILGPTLRIFREDGAYAEFPASLTDFNALSEEIQSEVFRRQWPSIWRDFQAGEAISFGMLHAHVTGLFYHEQFLRWGMIEDAIIAGNQLQIRAKSMWKPWVIVPLDLVVNPQLLLLLISLADPADPIPRSIQENASDV